MSPIEDGRSDFRDRVDKHPNPNWPPLPLTRIANALVAADIAKSGLWTWWTARSLENLSHTFFMGALHIVSAGEARIWTGRRCQQVQSARPRERGNKPNPFYEA
jgi:hypothetical protein